MEIIYLLHFLVLDLDKLSSGGNDDKPPELAPNKRISMINRDHSNESSPALPPKKSSLPMFGSTGSLTETTSSSVTGKISPETEKCRITQHEKSWGRLYKNLVKVN